jgi:hypothetical protein
LWVAELQIIAVETKPRLGFTRQSLGPEGLLRDVDEAADAPAVRAEYRADRNFAARTSHRRLRD